jgi:4-hydroxy-tetrahydrodipicolinate synthase
MLAKDFRGTGVAIVTPFTKEGSIDWEALKKLIDFLSNGKVEYLVVMGTTGENVTITKEEKQEIFSYVARHIWQAFP